MSSRAPSATAQKQKQAEMSTNSGAGAGGASGLDIESQVNAASGVNLSERQKVLVSSVLDLFKGKPSLPKLSLWTDDATFADPLTNAEGRKQYSAQWYGLVAAFSKIEQLSSEVISSGNPIEINLKTKYTVKGIGKEQVIQSLIKIHTVGGDGEGMKIKGVEDRWDGDIPDGAIAKVFRNLNSVVVPLGVSVPKNEEEDKKKGL